MIRGGKKRSPWFNWYILETEDGVKRKLLHTDKLTCKLCQRKISYGGTTTTIKRHIETMHPEDIRKKELEKQRALDPNDKKLLKTQSIEALSLPKMTSKRQEMITDALVTWIAIDGRPLTILEDPGLAKALEKICPGYVPRTITTGHDRLMSKYRHVKNKVLHVALLFSS